MITEKDAARLIDESLYPESLKSFTYSLPLHVNFLFEGQPTFNNKIKSYVSKINETASYLKSKMTRFPKGGIILGTGLGELATQITDKQEIRYEDIPNFPVSTVRT